MEVLAKGKYLRVSPKKARPVADLIRGKNALEAQIILESLPQKAAKVIKKVLDSAVANAANNFNLDKEGLVVSSITVDKGPFFKRYQPRAMGRATEIKRKTSHIEIVVSGDLKVKKNQKDQKSDDKEMKVKENTEKKDNFQIIRDKQEKSAKQNVVTKKVFRRKTG